VGHCDMGHCELRCCLEPEADFGRLGFEVRVEAALPCQVGELSKANVICSLMVGKADLSSL
jgi:hypothetical protein